MKLIKYFKNFHGKCDCCKRVTAVVGKLEVKNEKEQLLGDINLCQYCYNAFAKNKNLEEKEEIEFYGEEDDEEEENPSVGGDEIFSDIDMQNSVIERLW